MLTLSSPSFGAKSCSARPSALRFSGKEEYEAYLKKLQAFKPDTVAKLADITRTQKTAPLHEHIAMAVRYGKEDPNIKWFTGEILGLMRQAKPGATEDPAADLQKAATDTLLANGYDESGNRLNALA